MSFLDRFKRKSKSDDLPASQTGGEKSGSVGGAKWAGADPVGPKKAEPEADEVRLVLGDFLHRIPAQLLLPGPHDLDTELRFETGALSQRIASGITMVNLAEIYRRVPQIFRAEVIEAARG